MQTEMYCVKCVNIFQNYFHPAVESGWDFFLFISSLEYCSLEWQIRLSLMLVFYIISIVMIADADVNYTFLTSFFLSFFVLKRIKNRGARARAQAQAQAQSWWKNVNICLKCDAPRVGDNVRSFAFAWSLC